MNDEENLMIKSGTQISMKYQNNVKYLREECDCINFKGIKFLIKQN